MHLSNELLSELTHDEYMTFFAALKDTTVEMGLSATFTTEGLRGVRVDNNSDELIAFALEYLAMLDMDVSADEIKDSNG